MLEETEVEKLSVLVVWSSQLGAKPRHVASAAALMPDPRAVHYWDPDQRIGEAFEGHLPDLGFRPWDVWLLFAPGTRWEGRTPPQPTWWEHQLGYLMDGYGDLRLDPDRFARKARELDAVRSSRSAG